MAHMGNGNTDLGERYFMNIYSDSGDSKHQQSVGSKLRNTEFNDICLDQFQVKH